MRMGEGYVSRHDPTESPIAKIGLRLAFRPRDATARRRYVGPLE
jgi:hypothetical protein